MASGKCKQVLKGHSYGIRAVAVTSYGTTCISGSGDTKLRWDLCSVRHRFGSLLTVCILSWTQLARSVRRVSVAGILTNGVLGASMYAARYSTQHAPAAIIWLCCITVVRYKLILTAILLACVMCFLLITAHWNLAPFAIVLMCVCNGSVQCCNSAGKSTSIIKPKINSKQNPAILLSTPTLLSCTTNLWKAKYIRTVKNSKNRIGNL